MEKRKILIILIGNRQGEALHVQKVLTQHGCIIKTRLGIHEGVLERCSNTGLIILELAGGKSEIKNLIGRLKVLRKVKTRLVEISV